MLDTIIQLALHTMLQVAQASSAASGCVSGGGSSGPRTVSTGCVDLEGTSGLTLKDIVGNITDLLSTTIIYVASAVFLYGAFLYILSAFKEENKATGQQYMIGAIIGLVIVLTARLILNLVLFFIYA